MTHPFKWYPIHVAKTGKLKTYHGQPVRSWNDLSELVAETFRKHGLVDGLKSMLFEKAFPLFAVSQLPKTIEFWRSRWNKMESEFQDAIGKRRAVTVVEIGCGGGDLLIQGALLANRRGSCVTGFGLDIDPDAIAFANGYARSQGLPDLDFFVGDAIKGSVREAGKDYRMDAFAKKKLGTLDIVLVEGVLEWLRPYQDQLLQTLFSLHAKEYIILAASEKALESTGGRFLTSIARMSGEEVRGFDKQEFKDVLEKYAGGKKVSVHVCGGEWYPEAFYVARIR